MPEMKNSGVEWIGMIPSNWCTAKYKHFSKNRMGETILINDTVENGIPVYSATQDDKFLGYVENAKVILHNNDIVIPARGNSIGFAKIVHSDTATCTQTTICSTDIHDIEPKFLYYCCYGLKDYWFQYDGSAIPQITVSQVENNTLALPPLEIQKSIANFLDQKCSEIDSLSADIQSQIDVLEEYKKSVIAEAVTKGLNPDVEMKDSGIEWAQQIPEHWGVMPNKFVMRKEKVLCPKYTGEDILSLTMNGVIVRDLDAGGKMPASFDGYQIVKPNNLLMCLFDYDVTPRCIGLIKNHGLTSPAYSQFVMKNGNSERYYYYYYLMIDNTKELLHLAKNLRHSFTEEQLGMINTPVPPIDEQIAVADYLDRIIAETDMVIADKKAQLETLAEYKKSLIYEYVTGKKEIPENV